MINKLLIFVPHPDDEINIASQVIYMLAKKKTTVKVCYMTNGDLEANSKDRLSESLKALKVLGLNIDSIICLGYGDCLIGEKHIYNTESGVIISQNGKTETYGSKDIQDYSFKKRGVHNSYCRRSIKADIYDVIMEEKADLIICVDFDSHPDHRALSLLFDECMGEVLKRENEYTPLVLKKFAYGGVYSGKADYYDYFPIEKTLPPLKSKRLMKNYELDNPYFCWDERIRIRSPKRCKTRLLTSNIIYKAAKKHVSQDIKRRVGAICNADVVYWRRRTDNLLKNARLFASSGCTDYLNDFKLFDCSDIRTRYDIGMLFDKGFWIPSGDDSEKRITILLDDNALINSIVIYQDVFHNNGITEMEIIIGNYVETIITNPSNPKIQLNLKNSLYSNVIEIKIIRFVGEYAGISEIEIFECNDVDINNEFDIETQTSYPRRKINILDKIDKYFVKPIENKENDDTDLRQLLRLTPVQIKEYLYENRIKRIVVYGYGKKGYELTKKLGDAVVACVDVRGKMLRCEYNLYETVRNIDLDMADIVIITSSGEKQIAIELKECGWHDDQIMDVRSFVREVELVGAR